MMTARDNRFYREPPGESYPDEQPGERWAAEIEARARSASGDEWDHRYRQLAEGEIILDTDEVLMDRGQGWRHPGTTVGQKAPDPAYTSHRWYRRLKALEEATRMVWIRECERDANLARAMKMEQIAYGRKATSLMNRNRDADLERAMDILTRMSLERTGWRSWFSWWRYSQEPLRNDAANLCRSMGYMGPIPNDSRMVGDKQ